ncbi:hypothetical protein F66182_9970 [Fusarium sp. NRRL 66182]|nr:hypothetical protein F66182_9970 [Fusarium sp. NRRL 66182]
MLNCTPPDVVDGNPDIVGPGVMTSKAETAITIVAVVVAYLTNSFDSGIRDNELDRMVIRWTTGVFLTVCPFDLLRPDPLAQDSPPREFQPSKPWQKAIQQFILVLSDQQLVTGLAILISGITNQNNLTGYEFSVMTSLAWFSSTTHLATMDALRTYLKDHKLVRNIRIVGILCVLLLLGYAFTVTTNVGVIDELRTVSVGCLYTDNEYDSWGSQYLPLVAWNLALILIVWGYVTRVADLCSRNGVGAIVSRIFKRKRDASSSSTPSSPASVESRAGAHGNFERHFQRAKSVVQVVMGGTKVYSTSVLSSFSTITFSFSYGVSQVYLYRWKFVPALTPETNHMSFGQLMPIFLLALPFLSAVETYNVYLEERPASVTSRASQTEEPPRREQENLNSMQASHTSQETDGREAGSKHDGPQSADRTEEPSNQPGSSDHEPMRASGPDTETLYEYESPNPDGITTGSSGPVSASGNNIVVSQSPPESTNVR